jgi:plasmid stabilization system protein ParE
VERVYRLTAARDLAEARRWYEARRPGLGGEFRQAVRAVEDLLTRHPDAFPRVHGAVRRALVPHFPYAIYYQRLDADVLEIVACLHTSRRPGALTGGDA